MEPALAIVCILQLQNRVPAMLAIVTRPAWKQKAHRARWLNQNTRQQMVTWTLRTALTANPAVTMMNTTCTVMKVSATMVLTQILMIQISRMTLLIFPLQNMQQRRYKNWSAQALCLRYSSRYHAHTMVHNEWYVMSVGRIVLCNSIGLLCAPIREQPMVRRMIYSYTRVKSPFLTPCYTREEVHFEAVACPYYFFHTHIGDLCICKKSIKIVIGTNQEYARTIQFRCFLISGAIFTFGCYISLHFESESERANTEKWLTHKVLTTGRS